MNMPNKITAKMPSKISYIVKYGDRWFYEWDKARKEYNNLMGIAMIDWIESENPKYKHYRYGISQRKIFMINIYSPTWVKPTEISWSKLPEDMKYYAPFSKFKPL